MKLIRGLFHRLAAGEWTALGCLPMAAPKLTILIVNLESMSEIDGQ